MNYSQLKYIQTTMNLSNIKNLTLLDGFRFETPDIFIEILKSAIQLTSLTVSFTDLIGWFDDDELCKYLNNYIKKLDLSNASFENSDQLEQFCKVFGNLEQLICFLNQSDILFLIKHLHKLIYIAIYGYSNYHISWIKEEVEKLGLDITVDLDDNNIILTLFIWINRN